MKKMEKLGNRIVFDKNSGSSEGGPASNANEAKKALSFKEASKALEAKLTKEVNQGSMTEDRASGIARSFVTQNL